MNKGDEVYVANYEQIIYYLLKIDSPTKYVHSNLLFTQTHAVFEIKAQNEIRRIISKNPKFVLIQKQSEIVEKLIKGKYRLIKTFNKERIKLYELTN